MSVFDQEDDDKDYLVELTGPGGKFDRTKYTSEIDMYKAIAKSNVHGDRTISQRNTEFDQLRADFLEVKAEATAAAKLEELIKKYETRDTNTTNNQVGNVEATLDPKKVEDIVAAKLQEIEQKRTEKANLDKVDSRLREQFGDSANSVLKDRMETLGISSEDLKFIARKSPEAVFNTLGLNQQRTEEYSALPKSNTRSDSFKPQTTVRDGVYYEKLRKEDPKTYYSQTSSVQRLKDMENPDFLKRLNEQRST